MSRHTKLATMKPADGKVSAGLSWRNERRQCRRADAIVSLARGQRSGKYGSMRRPSASPKPNQRTCPPGLRIIPMRRLESHPKSRVDPVIEYRAKSDSISNDITLRSSRSRQRARRSAPARSRRNLCWDRPRLKPTPVPRRAAPYCDIGRVRGRRGVKRLRANSALGGAAQSSKLNGLSNSPSGGRAASRSDSVGVSIGQSMPAEFHNTPASNSGAYSVVAA